ncbi:MAG: hypothetical protein ACFFBV_10285 [Promethearchaeota archaeon]
MSIEYIVVTHKESHEVIYYKTAGDFDADFLDIFRSSIQYEILDLPLEEGAIEQATLEGKYLISRAGKMIWITLITKQKPILIAREALSSFCIRFEKLYKQELLDLYTEFNGDISIFRSKSFYKVSVDMIIDDEFHIRLTLPYKLGSTKGKKISSKGKKIYQFAKSIAHKKKGRILLETLFYESRKSLKLDNIEIADLIYDLVQNEILIPIPQEKLKKKFPIHY